MWIGKWSKNLQMKKQNKGTERSNSVTSLVQSEHPCKSEHKFRVPEGTKGASAKAYLGY